jgi:hypothetical protein
MGVGLGEDRARRLAPQCDRERARYDDRDSAPAEDLCYPKSFVQAKAELTY